MLSEVFDGSLMPHGQCLLWRWDLLFLHAIGDVLTVLAYAIIPIGLVHIVRNRDDLRFNNVFLLFAGFIAFCGISHLLGLINIWNGYYYLEGLVKLSTGVVSIASAMVLWRLMPQILALPSAVTLSERNIALQAAQDELKRANATLEQKVAERTNELYVQANTDYLTGLKNRRAIIEDLETEIGRAVRYNRPCSVMMIDVDHFKSVNDNHGHQAGDIALTSISAVLSKSCRAADKAGRYGGEEFLVVLPETSLHEATELAERIRSNVASCQHDAGLRLTVSIGVASINFFEDTGSDQLIKRADDAVYRAKKHGRNRVESAEGDQKG